MPPNAARQGNALRLVPVQARAGPCRLHIIPAVRQCVLAGGDPLPYGTLVIASGTRPRTLAVPGADLPAVHTYRTLTDASAIREEAPAARKALVVGGSFIGSEVAASLRMLGLDVTIVEMGDRLVPALSAMTAWSAPSSSDRGRT